MVACWLPAKRWSRRDHVAPVVFVIGADRFADDTQGRAAFYVGATRAKLLLYVTGITREHSLLTEADAALKQMAVVEA